MLSLGYTKDSPQEVIIFAYGEQCSEINDILVSLLSIYLVKEPCMWAAGAVARNTP